MRAKKCSCLTLLMMLLCGSVSRSAEPPVGQQELAAKRLAEVKLIGKNSAAAENWEHLVTYVREGPSYEVRVESAGLLARVQTEQIRNALLGVACDARADPSARVASISGLRGHAGQLKDEDIERLLQSDPNMKTVLSGTLVELAGRAPLSVEQVKRILGRYEERDKPNVAVLVVVFAGKFLENHRDDESAKATRQTIVDFLHRCASSAASDPPNLKPAIAGALAENRLPGAVEATINCLKDGLARQRGGDTKYRPNSDIARLKALTGQSMGFDAKTMKPGAPATQEVIQRWLEWWDRNGDKDPLFRIPRINGAEGSESKAGKDRP